jgi:hypothetical protein
MFGLWLAVVEGTLLGFDAQRVIALQATRSNFFGLTLLACSFATVLLARAQAG